MTKYAVFASALVLAAGTAFAEQQSERQSSWENEQSASAQGQDIAAPVSDSMIRQLQQALSEQGQDVQADGVWGPKTHQALRQYQQEQGLEPSGQIDTDTLASLNLEDQQTAAMDQEQMDQDQQASMGQDQEASAENEQTAEWEQADTSEQMEEEMSAATMEGEPAEEASGVREDPREDEGSVQATAPADTIDEEAEQSLEQAEAELEEGQQELEQEG